MAGAINVSDAIKASFRAAQRKALEILKQKPEDFNQDCNAVSILLALKEAKVEFGKANSSDVLQILKIGGNASANRQALEGKTEKATAGIADELLKMVK